MHSYFASFVFILEREGLNCYVFNRGISPAVTWEQVGRASFDTTFLVVQNLREFYPSLSFM